MKKSILFAAIVSAAVMAPNAFAQSAGDTYRPDLQTGEGHAFVAGSVGRTDGGTAGRFGTGDFVFNSSEGSKTGYSLTGGYRWKVTPSMGVGVEGGYADLGNMVIRNALHSGNVDQRSHRNALRGFLVGGNVRANINPQWYVSGRGGFFRASDNNINYYNTLGDRIDGNARSGRNSWYAGVGTGWNATENLSVGLHYDYYRAKSGRLDVAGTNTTIVGPKRSTAVLGVGVEYSF